MAYKPESIGRHKLCKGAARRAVRDAKRAATRKRRQAERLDPEHAPIKIRRGWVD